MNLMKCYRDIYENGKQSLLRAEIEEADLDARLLLEYVCATNSTTLFAHPEKEVTKEQAERYEKLIEQRCSHVPLQYLTGVQEFMGLTFKVNEHVLIPRQDTEILVEEAMRRLHDGMRILDVCTGSGCIILSLLHYSNDTTGVGLDISSKALEIAKKNAEALEKAGRVCFLQSDLFEAVDEKFDMIVSNPPYIATEVIETLMPEVRDYEPRIALDGMTDGLSFYRSIIEEAGKYLKRGGQLFFEIGYDQARAVSELMKQKHYTEIEVKKDYAGLDRVVYGTFLGGV